MPVTAFLFTDCKDFSSIVFNPIDGLSAGTFTSMWGDVVEFKPEDLEKYAANTKRVINSTKTESGDRSRSLSFISDLPVTAHQRRFTSTSI